jgi:dipeptidyl aminopeptidase/acylaminoacyl peptidase
MICPCSRSRYRWLRRLGALVCVVFGCCQLPPASAQVVDFEKPLQTIDEDITAFAFAPDGRIVYSVRRNMKTKLYDLQHDDIWLQETNGKRKRLLLGEKFKVGDKPFSYAVDSFRWSPDGHQILACLFVTSLIDDSGRTQDSFMTVVLDDNGKEVRINGGENVIRDSANAFWLKDNVTVVYLTEAVKPRALFSFQYTNLKTGPAGAAFEGRTFLDVGEIRHTNVAIGVEQDRAQTGPPRLQRLDLLSQDDTELATIEDFAGGLSISPSGKKAAYYIDKEVLEIRDLTAIHRVARVRVGMGVFHWSPDETRILLKRAVEKKTAELVWMDLPETAEISPGAEIKVAEPSPQPILRAVTFRDFSISEDGKLLGVIAPGKHNLFVFPLTVK